MKRWIPLSRYVRRTFGPPLAALAIALQCLVIQTHVDPAAFQSLGDSVLVAVNTVEAISAPSSEAPGRTQHGQYSCPICQAAALSANAVLGTIATIDAIQRVVLDAPLLPSPIHLSSTPSHAWRSRGPPVLH